MDNLLSPLSEIEVLQERIDILELQHQSMHNYIDRIEDLICGMSSNMQGMIDLIKSQSPDLKEE